MGLGLTVARKLTQLMGGDLVYERRDGWSVFQISLPTAPHPIREPRVHRDTVYPYEPTERVNS